MGEDVGIVIPAYNPDPERLATYIVDLQEFLDPTRIRVELDVPSTAVTAALADVSVSVHTSPTRRGKGAAIAAGFDALETEVVAFVDADGSTPPDSLADVLDPVLSQRVELAVGSRRHPDATVGVHQSRVRRRLGDVFVQIARRILPIELYDYQCGAKAIRRETWETIRDELASSGFAWDIEFVTMAHAVGAQVEEVPIVWHDKAGSTVGLAGTTSAFAVAMIRAWHRARVLEGARWNRFLDRFISRNSPPRSERDRGIEQGVDRR